MAKKYKKYEHTYFNNHPEITKIFDDLEVFLDFCRLNWMPFNPADLYNRESYIWRAYEKSTGVKRTYPRKQHNSRPAVKPTQSA
jgi:hypothetical protein